MPRPARKSRAGGGLVTGLVLYLYAGIAAGTSLPDSDPGTLRIEVAGNAVTIHANGVTIEAVLAEIARQNGLEISLAEPLEDRVTIELDAEPLPAALHRILRGRSYILKHASLDADPSRIPGARRAGTLRVLPGNIEPGGGRTVSASGTGEQTQAESQTRRRIDDIRASAARPREDALEHLRYALVDQDPEVRIEAVNALTEVGGSEASAALSGALVDADPWVRQSAVYAVGATGGTSAPHLLQAAVADADVRVRAAAVEALAMTGGASSVRLLGFMLSDSEPALRSQAVEVLAELGGDTAASLIRHALEDPDTDVRETARLALDME